MKKRLIGTFCVTIVLIAAGIYYVESSGIFSKTISISKPEISGWIAWWKEEEGYELLDKNIKEFSTISPYWLEIDNTYNLKEVGPTKDKAAMAEKYAKKGIRITPLVNTSLAKESLSPIFDHTETLVDQIVGQAVALNVPGIDLDIEEVSHDDKAKFTHFLTLLHEKLKEKNKTLIVSVLSQTGDTELDGESTRGVDLEVVARLADQVNVLVYDLHGNGSDAGPITTIPWLREVIEHSLKSIPKEKLVVGLPMYGYNWQLQSTTPDSYSYDDFMDTIDADKHFTKERDAESAELVYTARGQEAWLADYESVQRYIEVAKEYGLNRFMIWQISGMDERLFSK